MSKVAQQLDVKGLHILFTLDTHRHTLDRLEDRETNTVSLQSCSELRACQSITERRKEERERERERARAESVQTKGQLM